MENIKAKIENFLSHFFANYELRADENIFALGFVNSMFAMQLVLFIEQEFQIIIENEDLDFDNFSTINAMAFLVERKIAIITSN